MELEQKLALIQQMRQEQNGNDRREEGSTFRLRVLIAAFLFLLFFFMDVRNVSLGSVDSAKVQAYVSENLSIGSLPVLVDEIY